MVVNQSSKSENSSCTPEASLNEVLCKPVNSSDGSSARAIKANSSRGSEYLDDLSILFDKKANVMGEFYHLRDSCSSKSSTDVQSSERESSSSSPDLGSSDLDSVFLAHSNSSIKDPKSSNDEIKFSTRSETVCNSDFEKASPEVLKRIATMVEYYLGDDNLAKDMFLLKHVIKHREGFVSLKLLSNYKRMKRICNDWRLVKLAVENSKVLEINLEGTKVRRMEPLPEELEFGIRPYRSILAYDIAAEQASIDKLAEVFGSFGEINSLQIHKPGGRNLPDVQLLARENPQILKTVCAVVEYEKVPYARQALKVLSSNKTNSMKVIEMQSSKKLKHPIGIHEYESSYFSASELDEPFSPFVQRKTWVNNFSASSSAISSRSVSPFGYRPRSRFTTFSPDLNWRKGSNSSAQLSSEEGKLFNSPSPSDSPFNRRHWASATMPISKRLSPPSSPVLKNGKNFDRTNTIFASSNPGSPWVKRRLQGSTTNKSHNFPNSCPTTPVASPLLKRRTEGSKLLPENIIRMPTGPDGSIGFKLRRL